MEPITLIASTIATLAFQKFLDTSAGELGKQMAGGTISQLKTLHQKLHEMIVDRLRGRSAKVDEALVLVEQGDAAALSTLAKNLDVAMDEDEDFAAELRELASGLAWEDEHEPKEQILAELKEAIRATKSGQTFPISELWDHNKQVLVTNANDLYGGRLEEILDGFSEDFMADRAWKDQC